MKVWFNILCANSFAISLSIVLSRAFEIFVGAGKDERDGHEPKSNKALTTTLIFLMSFMGALLGYCLIYLLSGYLPMAKYR